MFLIVVKSIRNEKMKFIAILLAAALSIALISCGSSKEVKKEQPKSDYTTTPSGLKYRDVKNGTGAVAKTGMTVSAHYVGTLEDGTKFDSSRDRGKPFSFKLGACEVIKGWDEGLLDMKVGGIRQLIIPPDLGYGSRATGAIPPNSTLIFEIELMDVK